MRRHSCEEVASVLPAHSRRSTTPGPGTVPAPIHIRAHIGSASGSGRAARIGEARSDLVGWGKRKTCSIRSSFHSERRVSGLSLEQHWDAVYRDRVPELVTWHQDNPALSLSLIAATGLGTDASVVDVGGGCSRLADCLLEEGFTNLTVLDVSSVALGYGRQRLGNRADDVTWIEADVLQHHFDAAFDLWHDRAVFHFLVDPADQDRYVERLTDAVPSGGHVIISTFALDGPDRCSGLPVQRYGPEDLSRALGDKFEAADFQHETHHTPTGATQQFLYARFQRRTEDSP